MLNSHFKSDSKVMVHSNCQIMSIELVTETKMYKIVSILEGLKHLRIISKIILILNKWPYCNISTSQSPNNYRKRVSQIALILVC